MKIRISELPPDPGPDVPLEKRRSYLLMLEYLGNQPGAPTAIRDRVRELKSEEWA